MSDKTDQVVWSRVLNYFSKFIIPLCLSGLCVGGLHAYSTVRDNKLNVTHIQSDVKRMDSQYNSRVMANQLGLEKVNEKVSTLEALLPQILTGVDDIKQDIRRNSKYQKEASGKLAKLSTDIAVLKDRDKREQTKDKFTK